jgi:ABC-2 type transport system permease protein
VREVLRRFGGLIERDLVTFKREFWTFVVRSVLQPFLFVFTVGYIFPRVGQNYLNTTQASSIFVAGAVSSTTFIQGIPVIGLPTTADLGFHRQSEGQWYSPSSTRVLLLERVLFAAAECFIAALVVLPLVWLLLHQQAGEFTITVPGVLTLLIGGVVGACFGLAFGTFTPPTKVATVFNLVVPPIMFLGCSYYSWSALKDSWLRALLLLNPLTYVNELFRSQATPFPVLSPAVSLTAIALMCGTLFLVSSRRYAEKSKL